MSFLVFEGAEVRNEQDAWEQDILTMKWRDVRGASWIDNGECVYIVREREFEEIITHTHIYIYINSDGILGLVFDESLHCIVVSSLL